jgi:hypothetical protein
MAREEERMKEVTVRKFMSALGRLWDALESLEYAAESFEDLVDVEPIGYRARYERIRENLRRIWDAGERIEREIKRLG